MRLAEFWFPIFILACLPAVGCASGAEAKNMVPSSFATMKAIGKSVKVEVKGGRDTNPMWKSEISSEALTEAIEESLRKSQVFAEIRKDSADYLLEVTLLNVNQPIMGFDMTVALLANWAVIESAKNEVCWKKDIPSTYTATVGDAFVGTTRLRLANEGAGRENIRQGIEELGKLKLATYRP